MTRTHTPDRIGAATVGLAPVVLLIAYLSHPYIPVLPDPAAVGDAVVAGKTRWGLAHVLTNVGSALVALAFLAIRARLREAGEDRFSRWGLPFVILGSVLYGFLPGLEFAPLAAAQTGGDVTAVQAALEPWFVTMFAAGVITFGIGVVGFARGVAATSILGRRTTRVVVTALAVMAAARAVPVGVVQFHVQGLAALVALWPLANALWREQPAVATGRRRSPSAAV